MGSEMCIRDRRRKIGELSEKLSKVDYVFMADKRAYGTYIRLPETFPVNYFYYTTMLKTPEKLGFKKVHEVKVYPSFLGITIKDDKADESFQLYDHPHVYIFKNEKHLSQEELRDVLTKGKEKIVSKYKIKREKEIGKSNPNLGEIKDRVLIILPSIACLNWYIIIQILAFSVLPLCFILFKNFKDKGFGLSKVLGIFLFAWINWILVSLNIWRFYQGNLLILFIGFIILGIILYKIFRESMVAYFRKNLKHILLTEIIFLGAYMFFILIKLYAPDIHNVPGHGYNGGGEPMGMAYLSAIFNDVKFPPHDPWLYGFTLNYYYWGQLLLASISKLGGILPQISYNLSLSMLFALCFLTAFTLVYNITGRYKYGLFGGFLLAMAGNFHTLTYIYSKIIYAISFKQIISGIIRFQFIWDPTRIYPHPVITEVPFFSYLYGDLHAHNIVIPFAVLFIALLYNMVKEDSLKKGYKIVLYLFFLSLFLGSMWPMNTWNYPPMVILTFVVLCIGGIKILYDKIQSKPVSYTHLTLPTN